MQLQQIINAIKNGHYRITDHADEEAQADHLHYEEIFGSVMRGEIIEDYPEDKPYPSCLILGFTYAGEPVHSVWAINAANEWSILITVYRPDPARWIDFKKRMPKQ